MTKMELLNSFFIERLTSVAGEIFEVVKKTVFEYQEEIEKTKQENLRLRKILTHISVSADSGLLSPDVQVSGADGAPFEQNSNQRQLNSDPSLLQLNLELATINQESEPQPQLSDTWTCHPDGVLQMEPNHSPGPQDPEPSLIQVKLKLETKQEENGPQQQFGTEKHTCGEERSQSGSLNDLEIDGRNDALHEKSEITVKVEPIDSQLPESFKASNQTEDNLDPVESVSGIQTYQSKTAAHSQRHVNEEALDCIICGKLLKSAWLLKKHMIAFHQERPYRCDLCGKSYSYAHTLKVHLRTHSNERPFQCKSCGKMYKKKSHLKEHERIHTGDKPYSCSACGMCFFWTNQVKVHIHNHHHGQLATVIKKPLKPL